MEWQEERRTWKGKSMTRPKYAEENDMTVINGVWVTPEMLDRIDRLKTEIIAGVVLTRGKVVASVFNGLIAGKDTSAGSCDVEIRGIR